MRSSTGELLFFQKQRGDDRPQQQQLNPNFRRICVPIPRRNHLRGGRVLYPGLWERKWNFHQNHREKTSRKCNSYSMQGVILEIGSNQFEVNMSDKHLVALKVVEGPN